jgi:glutamine cyclotransferase
MRVFNLLAITVLLFLFASCNGSKSDTSPSFTLKILNKEKKFKQSDTLAFSIETRKGASPDSISYTLKGEPIKIDGFKLPLNDVPLGKHLLQATIFRDLKKEVVTSKITVLSAIKPKVYTLKIVNEFPHDSGAYTQGLEFNGDTLYEGTGRYKESKLRKLDFKTGDVYKEIKLQQNQFGEGITILNDKIYQLTWKNKVGFVYDLYSMKKIKSFPYQRSIEGWGLTNDGKHLYKSDGTENIWILDPVSLEEKGYIQVTSNAKIYNKVNELEYVDGKIYANSYQNDGIMIIDASTGALLGVVDGRMLKKKVNQHEQLDVLNGIAYHHKRKTFFLTGKYWNKLFEVVFEEKQ